MVSLMNTPKIQLISLLTDFGTQDEYAGLMKGVILSVNPLARIIDISHQIEPQDLIQAAFMLRASYPFFPKGTVHTVVVDPGVGTQRDILGAEYEGHIFLAPDNGLLSLLPEKGEFRKLVKVTNRSFFRENVSQTFHGRDIFAPVAARLAAGLSLEELGPQTDFRQIQKTEMPKAFRNAAGEIRGQIIHIDRFGNLMSNIPRTILEKSGNPEQITVHIGTRCISGLPSAYGSVPKGHPLAIIGSRDYLEISVNCGNAMQYFGLEKGGRIRVIYEN